MQTATVAVIVACLVFELALARSLGAFECSLDLRDLPLLRLGGLMAICLGAGWFLYSTANSFIAKSMTSWWEPGSAPEPNGLSWDHVYELIAFDDATDPLGLRTRIRWRWWAKSLVQQLPIYLLTWGIALSAADLTRDPTPRDFLLRTTSPALSREMVTAIGNPSAYLALVGAAATIFFTFRQIRAKVRADSRQQWIIHARALLGQVVALIDLHRDLQATNRFKQASETWEKLNPLRLELELMLNPSEKDHRLLLYLIQRFAMWRTPFAESQDAKIVRRSICGITDPDQEDYEIPKRWQPIIAGDDRADMVSYILRLSHVVLKREWERVKHTR